MQSKQIAKSGRKILFVATKKQAKNLVSDLVKKLECLMLLNVGQVVCLPISQPSGKR